MHLATAPDTQQSPLVAWRCNTFSIKPRGPSLRHGELRTMPVVGRRLQWPLSQQDCHCQFSTYRLYLLHSQPFKVVRIQPLKTLLSRTAMVEHSTGL